MPGPVAVTVILPTFRRPASLAAALDGLAAQNDPGPAWRLVVIDNDDERRHPAADVVAARRTRFPVPIEVVTEPRRGSAHARNRGLAEADGGIVAMLDDDVVPDPDWLRALVEPLLAGRCSGVGGRVVLDPEVRRPRWYAAWMSACLAEFDHGGAEVDLRELVMHGSAGMYVLTANAAFLTEPLRATGGFDPVLGPRSGTPLVNDDVSLCRRFVAGGGTIRFVPGAVVVHELPPARLTHRYLLRRHFAQGRSDWLLDRTYHRTLTTGGLRGAAGFLAEVWGRVLSGRSGHGHAAFYAIAESGRAAGFVREAVVDRLVRRGRDPVD